MTGPEFSLFEQRALQIEAAKPIWDKIYEQLESLFPDGITADNAEDHFSSQLMPGAIYDWQVYVTPFDESIEQLNCSHAKGIISPWGHRITVGFDVDLWFYGGRKDSRRPRDRSEFAEDPKALVVCSREGVYDGFTRQLLSQTELEAFQRDVDRLVREGPEET